MYVALSSFSSSITRPSSLVALVNAEYTHVKGRVRSVAMDEHGNIYASSVRAYAYRIGSNIGRDRSILLTRPWQPLSQNGKLEIGRVRTHKTE